MDNELWVVMKYQYRFISCKKHTTLVGFVDNCGGYACVGAGGTREISVPFSQFCCEPKTAQKNCLSKKTIGKNTNLTRDQIMEK